jgi:hypothetical protein
VFDRGDNYHFINQPFVLLNFSSTEDTVYLDFGDSVELKYALLGPGGGTLIEKSVVFSADKYINNHFFEINDDDFDYSSNLEILWYGGLRPTEEKEDEDVQYGSGIISQAGEIEDVQIKKSDKSIAREMFKGRTEWVGVRTKYFMSALIVESLGEYAVLSAENVSFGHREQTPLHSAGVGYPLDVGSISSKLYLGPLDVDHIAKTGTDLDAAMNLGFSLIRPISKGVLWVLKFMHNTPLLIGRINEKPKFMAASRSVPVLAIWSTSRGPRYSFEDIDPTSNGYPTPALCNGVCSRWPKDTFSADKTAYSPKLSTMSADIKYFVLTPTHSVRPLNISRAILLSDFFI